MLPKIPGARNDDDPDTTKHHARSASLPSPTGVGVGVMRMEDLPDIRQQYALAQMFRAKVEQVMADNFSERTGGGRPQSGFSKEQLVAQEKAAKAAARHHRYHMAVKRGRDPRTFSRNEGPLWSTVSQLDDKARRAAVGVPLHKVLYLDANPKERQAPINDSLNIRMQPVKHAAAAIQYMGTTAYKDSESQNRHLKGNIEAQMFGESTLHVSRAQAQSRRMHNERLVPNFNPDTDLVR